MCSDARGFFVPGNTRSMSWKAYETDGASCISYAILVQRWIRAIRAYTFSEPVWHCRVRGERLRTAGDGLRDDPFSRQPS